LYLISSTEDESIYRILKIDRTNTKELSLIEDETRYTKAQINDLLKMMEMGNQSGFHFLAQSSGLLGFIRFLSGYYMLLISKKSEVAIIGGHKIYHIEDTLMIPIHNKGDIQGHPDEARFVFYLFN